MKNDEIYKLKAEIQHVGKEVKCLQRKLMNAINHKVRATGFLKQAIEAQRREVADKAVSITSYKVTNHDILGVTKYVVYKQYDNGLIKKLHVSESLTRAIDIAKGDRFNNKSEAPIVIS